MNKSTTKRKRHNVLAVNITAEKFGFTPRYVRGCLTGEHQGIMPDEIKKTYKQAVNKIQSAVEKIKQI